MKRIQIIVPVEFHRQLKAKVAAEGTDISTVVREMLEKYLSRKEEVKQG